MIKKIFQYGDKAKNEAVAFLNGILSFFLFLCQSISKHFPLKIGEEDVQKTYFLFSLLAENEQRFLPIVIYMRRGGGKGEIPWT